MSSGAKRAMPCRDRIESRMGTNNVHAGEDGDGAGGVADDGADAQAEEGEEGQEGSRHATARSTPGCPSDAVGAPPESTAWPSKNDDEAERLADDQGARARRRRPWPSAARRAAAWQPGTSGSCPVPYSPLMARTPRTPRAREPSARPARDWLVGIEPLVPRRGDGAGRCGSTGRSTSSVPTTVMSSVHSVERSETSLVHSARMVWRSPARQARTCGGAVRR